MSIEGKESQNITWHELLHGVAEDVDEILSLIAYDNKSDDPDFIKKNQEKLKKKYEGLIQSFEDSSPGPVVTEYKGFRVYNPEALVLQAYRELMDLGVLEYAAEAIREDAENAVQENLVVYFDLLQKP